MLETRAKIELADANLLESIREHARRQDPCDCVEQDGVLLVAGANPLPIGYRNCVVRVNRDVAASEVLRRTREFLQRAGADLLCLRGQASMRIWKVC